MFEKILGNFGKGNSLELVLWLSLVCTGDTISYVDIDGVVVSNSCVIGIGLIVSIMTVSFAGH